MTLTAVRSEGIKLDVGAGAKREEGWLTMDVSPAYSPDFQQDLTTVPWPFEDEAVGEVRAWHVLEHLHRWDYDVEVDFDRRTVTKRGFNPVIRVLNETWRVLRYGGIADVEVPVFPYWTAIADPTHVSFWLKQSFDYLVMERHAEHRVLYGIRPWRLAWARRNENGSTIRVGLEKVDVATDDQRVKQYELAQQHQEARHASKNGLAI